MASRIRPARSPLLAATVALFMISYVWGAVTEKGQVRQPRNIYELVYAFEHTFWNVLQADELKQYRTMTPQQIKESNPELYERISRDVKRWTDEWLLEAKSSGDQIPQGRLSGAVQIADHVDAILKSYFEAKKWPYRPMRVVFLPPRLFLDERHRGDTTSGMFIPFYPDAFFATVDWPVPLELILVHESLHFNATGMPFGGPLSEGITETAARYLVRDYELVAEGKVNRVDAYPLERKGVEFVLEEIVGRTTRSHDEALELLLEAYLTGRQDEMRTVFGSEPWERVIGLSHTRGDWQIHKIAKALGK
jgi:hypothetical protein